jgi:hypothetical protein
MLLTKRRYQLQWRAPSFGYVFPRAAGELEVDLPVLQHHTKPNVNGETIGYACLSFAIVVVFLTPFPDRLSRKLTMPLGP